MKTLILAALLAAPGTDNKDNKDKKWVEEAATASMAEVRLSQLALKNAASPEVKTFAQQMIDEHTKANEELKVLAEKKSLAIPADVDAEHKRLEERLTKLNGEKFDSEYMKAMVSDHKKVVSHFEKGSEKAEDADIKAWATQKLPTLKHHKDMAESTEKVVKSGKKA